MKLLLMFVSVLFSTNMFAQSNGTGFVLDDSKPYVYLQFDHVAPRKPLQAGEGSQGLWLRIFNNCKVPITVTTYGVSSGDPGVGVLDEIIPIHQSITVQADSSKTQAAGVKPQQKMPQGYSAEISSATRILPGENLLFSVPRNHVSREWFMRVRFTLDVSKPSLGIGPRTELDFFNEQIP